MVTVRFSGVTVNVRRRRWTLRRWTLYLLLGVLLQGPAEPPYDVFVRNRRGDEWRLQSFGDEYEAGAYAGKVRTRMNESGSSFLTDEFAIPYSFFLS